MVARGDEKFGPEADPRIPFENKMLRLSFYFIGIFHPDPCPKWAIEWEFCRAFDKGQLQYHPDEIFFAIFCYVWVQNYLRLILLLMESLETSQTEGSWNKSNLREKKQNIALTLNSHQFSCLVKIILFSLKYVRPPPLSAANLVSRFFRVVILR